MKRFIKILFIFYFLSVNFAIVSMEKSFSDEPIEHIQIRKKADGSNLLLILQNKKNRIKFPQLVRNYAQNTLAKICILHILNNLALYEDKLDALPKELQDKINSLRSN